MQCHLARASCGRLSRIGTRTLCRAYSAGFLRRMVALRACGHLRAGLSTSTPGGKLEGEYDDVVIGGGIMGSSTAYELAKRGRRVLLLEQFDWLHRRGSSHGESRIIRPTYPEPYYVDMMKQAYPLWEAAQQEAGTSVYTRTGGLDFAAPGDKSLAALIKACEDQEIAHEVLTAAQLQRRFPLVRLPADFTAVLNAEAGMLHATKAVSMMLGLARTRGAVLRDRTRVLNVRPLDDGRVEVETEAGTVRCDKAVVTVGAWVGKLLRTVAGLELPTQPIHTTVGYYEVEDRAQWDASSFPVFIMYADNLSVYGCPSREYPGLIKVALHDGPNCDPDSRSLRPGFEELEGFITPFIQQNFVGVSSKVSLAEACMYTNTPDHDFVLDTLPGADNIVVGAACSGHGFKMGVLVGKILADLSTAGACTDVDMQPFRLARFSLEQ